LIDGSNKLATVRKAEIKKKIFYQLAVGTVQYYSTYYKLTVTVNLTVRKKVVPEL